MDACAFPSKLAPFLGPTVRKYVGSTAMTRCHFLFPQHSVTVRTFVTLDHEV